MERFKVLRAFKDELSILISVIALLASTFSIYLQFREVDSVAVRLVDIDTTLEHQGKAIVKVVLTNNGTLPYLVSEIRMAVSENASGAGASYPSDGSTLAKAAPFVLDKGKMKLIEVTVPVADILGTTESTPAYIGAMITSVDVNGMVHHADLWLAAVCVQSGMLIDGIVNDGKLSLKPEGKSYFEVSKKNPCSR